VAWLKRTFEPDHIWFVDDIFGLIPGWMDEFADLIEQKMPASRSRACSGRI